MGKLKILIGLVLIGISVLLILNPREELFVYQEVDMEFTTMKISDGEFMYTGLDKSRKMRDLREVKGPAMYLFPTDGEFHIEKTELVSYTGTLYDVSNYVECCKANGYTITSESYTEQYLDVKLQNSDQALIRIIYFRNGELKMFHASNGSPINVIPFLI